MKKKQNKMTDITVIVPVHNIKDDNFDKYYQTAIDSIKNNTIRPNEENEDVTNILPKKVLIPVPSDRFDEFKPQLETFDYGNLNCEIISNDVSGTFVGQMNYAIDQIDTDYFTFLEFDDEFGDVFFQNAKQYIEYFTDIDLFLPMITDSDEENNMLGFTNEAAWASEFTNIQGYLDIDTLLQYPNFNIDGMVMKTSAFKEVGKLKENIELTFNYEFLLRVLNYNKKILVIPKFLYKHISMRTNSLFWLYKNDNNMYITEKDAETWINVAKEEYLFATDREINKENYVVDDKE